MEKRIAIITGASSGIGKAAAVRLAGKGYRMVLNGRNEEKLKALKAEIDGAAVEPCRIVCGDVADEKTINTCIAECFNTWQQGPDIFLASAGRGLPGTVITSDAEQWNELLDTNVRGLMYQLRAISKTMLDTAPLNGDFIRQAKDIVVIGSSIGRNVSPFNSVYGATKFAVHGLTEALRRELGPQGIRVTLIEPGIVKTNFQEAAGYDAEWFKKYEQEVGPVLTGEDVAEVIGFLLTLPGNVNLDNISIRPTRQAYP